ncbi:MAG TPA: hypothetical protein VMG59_09795 [Phycisphaerae bacterium]|nr:hypothetical protein [Phycisphaerae bacterium]
MDGIAIPIKNNREHFGANSVPLSVIVLYTLFLANFGRAETKNSGMGVEKKFLHDETATQ